jgi:hypothetical protein
LWEDITIEGGLVGDEGVTEGNGGGAVEEDGGIESDPKIEVLLERVQPTHEKKMRSFVVGAMDIACISI